MRESVQRLVVIRGNSGSGKTSLARQLKRAMGRGTANVGQDHFRRVVLREHDVPGGDNIELIRRTALHCLDIGYHVILEGIFISDHYGQMLRDLVAAHDGESAVFYLDIPLEETLRRHDTRPMRDEVAPAKLREWYVPSDVLGIPDEVVIDDGLTEQETLQAMLDRIGPVRPRQELPGARFL